MAQGDYEVTELWYNNIERGLESKRDKELEEIVKDLTPKLKNIDRITYIGIGTSIASITGAVITDSIPQLKEYASIPGIAGLIFLAATVFYVVGYSYSRKVLGVRYKRNAARNILKRREDESRDYV